MAVAFSQVVWKKEKIHALSSSFSSALSPPVTDILILQLLTFEVLDEVWVKKFAKLHASLAVCVFMLRVHSPL